MAFAETFARIMSSGYADSSDAERNAAVRELVTVASVAGAAVSIQPLPLLDTALLVPIYVSLVRGIGKIHGYALDTKAVLEVLSSFGASLVAQHVVRSAVRLVPGFGLVVGASMGYALTYAIGEVSDHYFRTGRGISNAELREMFGRAYEKKRAEKASVHADDRSLRTKLEQLKDAFAAGLLTEIEFGKMKEQILAEF